MLFRSARIKFNNRRTLDDEKRHSNYLKSNELEFTRFLISVENEMTQSKKRSMVVIKHPILRMKDNIGKRYEYTTEYNVHTGNMDGYILYNNQLPLQFEKYCNDEYGPDNILVQSRKDGIGYMGRLEVTINLKALCYMNYRRHKK
jgi:type II restriction/modification system DNA methylase subunit YeeA